MAAVDGDDDCGDVAEPQWGVTGWRRGGGSVVGCGGSEGLPAVGWPEVAEAAPKIRDWRRVNMLEARVIMSNPK
nr:hypothetical protein [Tanacetum cinerariifolium]